MTTPNRGLVNSVENTLQPGVAFNWLADILDRRFGALTIDFAADATLELTQIQSDYSVLVFTDTGPVLTGPQDVEFPAAFPSVLVVNNTAQVLTMLKSGGTGVAVPVGASMRVSCGVTDVLSQTGAAAWGGIAGTLSTQTDLQAALDAKLALAGGSLSGTLNEAKGTDIASAGTTNIASATGNLVHITGTTTITALGTAQAGTRRILVFDGALLLTHNATSLILPTGANITTTAGDTATMVSEGSGNWRCTSYQRKDGTALAGSGGGLTNFAEAVNTSAPNATIPYVYLSPSNAATNVDIAIVPKGTGGFSFAVANNATSGGNKRGARSIDLQIYRGAQGQVTSSADTFAFGHSNAVNGSPALAIGIANTASNVNAMAFGQSCLSDGFGSTTYGYGSNARGVSYIETWAGYQFGSTDGSVQDAKLMLVKSTTNATISNPASDSSAATSTNSMVMPNNSAFLFDALVVAREAATGDTKSWLVQGHIKRGANAAATAMVAAATITPLAADAGASAWTLGVSANTTLGAPMFEVTGEAAKTIKWAVLIKNCLQLVG